MRKNKTVKIQITKIRNERGQITTDSTCFKKLKRICEQLYANKVDNLEEIDNFLKKKQIT